MTMQSKYITALLVERFGYERRGMTERVQAVDEALREVGYEHEYLETTTAEPDQETASLPKARIRKKG